MFDPNKFDYKKYVYETYGLTESPVRYRDFSFSNDDAILNSKDAIDIKKKDEFLGYFSLSSFKFEIYKSKEHDKIFINLLMNQSNHLFIYMFHEFKEISHNDKLGIESLNIWQWKTMKSLSRNWVFDFILNHYNFMLSDKIHTEMGEKFWKKLIEESFERKIKIGVINLKTNEFFKINNINDVDKYYDNEYSNYRFYIGK